MLKTIMIIEDDLETQLLFSELLEAEGYSVLTKFNGVEALEYLETNRSPDLIFMDLNFPGGTPEEFTQKLRENPETTDTPVILVSGKADIAEYAKKLNATNYVRKPFEINPLIELIHQTI